MEVGNKRLFALSLYLNQLVIISPLLRFEYQHIKQLCIVAHLLANTFFRLKLTLKVCFPTRDEKERERKKECVIMIII